MEVLKKERIENKMEIAKLEEIAKQVRREIISMLGIAGSGHPGGSLSSVEILVSLYFSVMRHDPYKNPSWEERDRFLLSKGHSCPALYSCLALSGYFPLEELKTLRKFPTRLQGHPAIDKNLPGIEICSGSLGLGLSVSLGIALGAKLDGKDYRIYCLLGDGEVNEGQVWEAAMAASHYKLDNLCAIIDANNFQLDGKVEEVMNLHPLGEKWKAFNWYVLEVDGHNFSSLLAAFEKAKENKGQPTVIIAHTVKGKGVSFMENENEWHGKAPSPQQVEQALKELI
jgi:transketolase